MGKVKVLSGDSAAFTLENAPIGIAHTTETGAFTFVNREYCNITGWPKDELLQMGWPDITHEADIMPDNDRVASLLRRDAPSYQLDKRYLTPQGKTVWVSLNVWAYFKGNDFQHFIVSAEDITERQHRIVRLEQRLDDAVTMVSKLNKRLRG